jgi:hypothetical protein
MQRPPKGSRGAIECLGIKFPSEQARRAHFSKLLAEKLKDPAFRKSEGFPQGTDEAILAMSDPPYYTACPNPFLEEFVRHYGKPYDPDVRYSRELQTIDVSVDKTDPPLQGALTSHQGAALSHRAVHPALHGTGRHRARRFRWLGHDRCCCAMVRITDST